MSRDPVRVLVVDDSGVMRAMVKEIIAADAAFVVAGEASDGLAAIAVAMRVKPNIVVLDIEMPKMNGIDFLRRLKLFSTASVVVLSRVAQSGSAIVDEVRRLGAFDVIDKPSGAATPDLKGKRGHKLLEVMHAAAGLPPPDFKALGMAAPVPFD